MLDTKALAAATANIVREHVEKAVAPLVARIGELEKHIADMPAPKDGKDADIEAVKAFCDGRIGEARQFILTELKAPELPDIPAMITEAVAAIPSPKDGHSPSLDELRPLIEECVSRAVAAVPAPKDGVNLAGALIDREGNLVLTLSDGTVKALGIVIGRDGKDGEPGKDGMDGAPGKDGVDGFGFDDLDLVETEAGVFLRFVKGEVTKDFRLPIVIDRGVFKEGTSYRKGDGVTWAGAFWIAQGETSDKPDGGKGGWRLAVKKGRDGRDGKDVSAAPVKVKV